jgi:pyrroline-5-carboxylate reductase
MTLARSARVKMVHLGFIGTGHMGSMLIRKFIETGAAAPADIIASNRTREKAELLAGDCGIRLGSNRDVAAQSDVVFLCVKPLDVSGVLTELRDELKPDKLLISVAVDLNLDEIASISRARATRAIPSICSESLKGVTLVSFGGNTTDSDRALIHRLFRAIGDPIEVEETDLEILADLTSSAPAYISAIMRELVLAATRKGVDAYLAERLSKETLEGTSELLAKESFDDLITRVATKGGITEEGLKAIRKHAPAMFDELLASTEAKHELIRKKLQAQEDFRE